VVAGPFLQAGGISSRLCAAWNGTSWSAASSTGFQGGSAIWDLQSIPVPGGAVLVCGGDFTSVNGISAETIAQWNGSTWSSVGGGLCDLTPSGSPPPTGVNALVVHDLGAGPAVFAAGYVSVGGSPEGSYVARWTGSGVVPLGGAFNGEIQTLASLDIGAGPRLYAAGSFSSAGGVVSGPVAYRFGAAWVPMGMGLSGPIYALTVFDNGTGPAIYAGGTNGIWKWNGATWVLVPGCPVNVRTLATFDPDGAGPAPPRLFAGGTFQTVGGVTARGIAQWNGTSWTSVGSGLTPTGSYVQRLIVADLGTGPSLLAGGQFDYAGGLAAGGVAGWTGTSWFTLAGGVQGNGGKVDDLVVCDGPGGPALYVCGAFGASPGANIARWNGSAWQTLGNGFEDRARAMVGFNDGTGPAVIVGGRFLRAGTLSSNYLARWGCVLPAISWSQSGGPGTQLSLTNSNLVPGHEYYDIFSTEVCGSGPGSGPYLGLCASDPSFLLWQFSLPIGATPVHFVAPSSTAQFGPFTVPPMAVDAVCFDWTGGVLGSIRSWSGF
jgi:hypothetical protein